MMEKRMTMGSRACVTRLIEKLLHCETKLALPQLLQIAGQNGVAVTLRQAPMLFAEQCGQSNMRANTRIKPRREAVSA